MAYDLQRFSSGTLDKGIQTRTMDFQGELVLEIGSYNASQGIQQGLGPRPGMSIIPGQADSETISGTRLPGLVAAEGSPAQGFSGRRKVLGVYAIKLPDPSDITQRITTYAFIVTTINGGNEYLDVVLCSTTNGSYESITANIYDGFGIPSYTVTDAVNYFAEAFPPTRTTTLTDFLLFANSPSGHANFLSSVIMSVTGPNVPMQWLLGKATAVGDVNHAPSLAFHKPNTFLASVGVPATFAGGVPTEYNLQNFTTTPRALKVFALTDVGQMNIEYSLNITPSTGNWIKDIFGATTVNLDLSSTVATKDTAGVGYANTVGALVNDPKCVNNASYKAVLMAGSKAFACLFQDSYRGTNSGNNGKTNQWFDLTQNTFQPRIFNSTYSDEGVLTKTSFAFWPSFVRGTPLATTYKVALGGPNTGILRANTVYEFTYSLYNKRLNFETNVGTSVKFQTGTDEFDSLVLYTPTGAGYSVYQDYYNGTYTALPPLFMSASAAGSATMYVNFANHLQYRFYYRQEGTFEWLPALFVDVPQYWFYPWTQMVACTGALAALPGGQPGGFNDYSPLPKDNYSCVVQYKDRAWWFSDKQVNFSLRNNIFCYPGRNSISATGGEFRGGIVHNYPGQAEQSSRLVIFGTRETYVARFTGNKAQAPVQVSPDEQGIFDIDGSDLIIDPWTSVTAFSFKAAAIAEGILYWWGPQGVFRDDGVNTPTRISADIEPDLFSLFDPNKTGEIIAAYNNQTKEVEWTYTPKVATATDVNRSIIFNTISGNWTQARYRQHIDWTQSVTIDTNIGTAGYRTLIGSRGSAGNQRAYFFDQRNRAGDFRPLTEFVVKAISTPSTGVRRLTLAAGGKSSTGTVAGDYIAIQQARSYASSLTAADDMIAVVAAVDVGAGTIDITLPTGATMDASATLTFDKFFPIWQRSSSTNPAFAPGINGIPYVIEFAYWMPKGINGYFFWLYCYLLSRMQLWKTDLSLGWSLSYRTPTASTIISDDIAFSDNSDGNFQVYHPLRPGNDNHEGQGMKFILSGAHIGHEWVVQYLEAHGTPIKGDPLKRFEG